MQHGLLAMADQVEQRPTLSHDRKWPLITKCTHLRVVGLRLGSHLIIRILVASLIWYCWWALVAGRAYVNRDCCISVESIKIPYIGNFTRLRFMLNAWLCVHYKFSYCYYYYYIINLWSSAVSGWRSYRDRKSGNWKSRDCLR